MRIHRSHARADALAHSFMVERLLQQLIFPWPFANYCYLSGYVFPESLGACWEANCVQGEMPTRRHTATLPFLNHRKNQTSIEQLNTFPGTHRDTNTQSIMTSTTVSSCSVQTRFLGHTNSFEPICKSLICEFHIPMYPIEILTPNFT